LPDRARVPEIRWDRHREQAARDRDQRIRVADAPVDLESVLAPISSASASLACAAARPPGAGMISVKVVGALAALKRTRLQ